MADSDTNKTPRLLAKLIRELLTAERFATIADLSDALKAQCGRLKIRWTTADINAAFRLILSNTPLLAIEPRGERETEPAPLRPLEEAEAKRLYAQFLARYASEHPAPTGQVMAPERPDDFPDLVAVRS
jgi:hypothetical protein